MRLRPALPAVLAVLALAASGPALAGTLRLCDTASDFSAAQQDKLLRFGARVKAELDASGSPVALVARSGLDLARFGHRYSHAGISLQASADSPWSVRQLYFACEERQPRLFDQGMAAFVLGTHEAALGYVTLLTLPPDAALALARSALDKALALQLLGARYSANAYPFSVQYQNCNQWVVELLAAALGGQAEGAAPREQAQAWLQAEGYTASVFAVESRLLWLFGVFVPWLHRDDHPAAELEQRRYSVSMPASIESFVHQRLPATQRVELCHTEHQVVVHRGWTAIAEGCVPGDGDQVFPLD